MADDEDTGENIKKLFPMWSAGNHGVVRCDVGIVGGGIAGLSIAYEILKNEKDSKVCVFEKDLITGGRVRDHHFKEVPNVDVGLGAFRINEKDKRMNDLADELNIKLSKCSFEQPTLYESRGVKADNEETIKTAYPILLAHPVFGHMTSGQMMSYALKPENVAQADQYATVDTYFSNLFTPEGAEFICFTANNGSLADSRGAEGFIESSLLKSCTFTGNYSRPSGGMSAFTNELRNQVRAMGGQIFTNASVKTLAKDGIRYMITTPKLNARCTKLVVATPPAQLRNISGDIAEQLQESAVFNSILPIPAFKAAAVYPYAWWEDVTIGDTQFKDGQQYISQSNGLGISVAYRGRGINGEAILHTIYAAESLHSTRWAGMASVDEDYLHAEIHRALEIKFGKKIPSPLKSVFQYWESGWHYQKPGTKFTLVDISNWAKRPLAGEDVFVIGEAYNPVRGWCEGAVASCHNALKEGWGIDKAATGKLYGMGRVRYNIEKQSKLEILSNSSTLDCHNG